MLVNCFMISSSHHLSQYGTQIHRLLREIRNALGRLSVRSAHISTILELNNEIAALIIECQP